MSKNPFETVLTELNFSEKEQKVFVDIIHYAKSCQKTGLDDTLKLVINNKIEEALSNEVS